VIECVIVCCICIVEYKEQHVTCSVEVNKLKTVEAVRILEAQTVMVVGVVGYVVTSQNTCCEDWAEHLSEDWRLRLCKNW